MKRMLCGFVVLALLVALQAQAAPKKKSPPPPPPPPDTYVVFYATGQFEGGYLTGTVTIDTTAGYAVAADLDVNGEVVFSGTPSTGTNSAGNVVIEGGWSSGIYLVIPSTSLKGYAGGELVPGEAVLGAMVGYESYWFWTDYSFRDYGIAPLSYGSLEP
jgi:hypothetical protein